MSSAHHEADGVDVDSPLRPDREGFKPLSAQRCAHPTELDALRRRSHDMGEKDDNDDGATTNLEAGDVQMCIAGDHSFDEGQPVESFIAVTNQNCMSSSTDSSHLAD